jgi:hypothetical protein
MKKALFASTSLLGVGLLAGPAMAADGIKLGLGGYFRTAYMGVIDDNGSGDLGHNHNPDGVFQDAQIHFSGSTVLDNGLEVGAYLELVGENSNEQIDEAWTYFSGGWGELRIGSTQQALDKSCIVPPGGTTNFSAFSPNQWGANTFTSNTVCTGVNEEDGAMSLMYITPIFGGFQLVASYTPNGGASDANTRGGPHTGMPFNNPGESRHNGSLYGSYNYQGDGWGLSAGAGLAFQGAVEGQPGPDRAKMQAYQGGVNLTFGNFSAGVVMEYFHNLIDQGDLEVDKWIAGAGIGYTIDAWTIGAQFSHLDQFNSNGSSDEFSQNRAVLTGNYDLGPGIKLDGELGYTWLDPHGQIDGTDIDNYHAFEIGIGTAITF